VLPFPALLVIAPVLAASGFIRAHDIGGGGGEVSRDIKYAASPATCGDAV
jgi:hypothetical protein